MDQFAIDKSTFDVNFVKTWFTICDPGQHFPCHYHSCAHISWVYYIQTPGDPLILHKKNPNEWFGDAFKFIQEHKYNNGDGYSITPHPEHLVMFPGSLEHYTAAEPREHRRISLAGDIILPPILKVGCFLLNIGRGSSYAWHTKILNEEIF